MESFFSVFFDDHTVSGPLPTLKGITAFTSSVDLVYVSCIFECTSDAIEHAQLHDLAPPPLHHEVIPDLLLDYARFPPIPASPNQLLRRRILQSFAFMTVWLSSRINTF